MSDKIANVHWEGRGKQGVGRISTETEALKSYPYGFASRFEDDKRGTNPEELLAPRMPPASPWRFRSPAMRQGSRPGRRHQGGRAPGDEGRRILDRAYRADPGGQCSRHRCGTFQKIAAKAKADCPLSKALASVPEIYR